MAKKARKTTTSRKVKKSSVVRKLNRALNDSEHNIQEIRLKPREIIQKLNDILSVNNFKGMEVDKVKLGRKKRKCKRYEAIYDEQGNIIGFKCVEWE